MTEVTSLSPQKDKITKEELTRIIRESADEAGLPRDNENVKKILSLAEGMEEDEMIDATAVLAAVCKELCRAGDEMPDSRYPAGSEEEIIMPYRELSSFSLGRNEPVQGTASDTWDEWRAGSGWERKGVLLIEELLFVNAAAGGQPAALYRGARSGQGDGINGGTDED